MWEGPGPSPPPPRVTLPGGGVKQFFWTPKVPPPQGVGGFGPSLPLALEKTTAFRNDFFYLVNSALCIRFFIFSLFYA